MSVKKYRKRCNWNRSYKYTQQTQYYTQVRRKAQHTREKKTEMRVNLKCKNPYLLQYLKRPTPEYHNRRSAIHGYNITEYKCNQTHFVFFLFNLFSSSFSSTASSGSFSTSIFFSIIPFSTKFIFPSSSVEYSVDLNNSSNSLDLA